MAQKVQLYWCYELLNFEKVAESSHKDVRISKTRIVSETKRWQKIWIQKNNKIHNRAFLPEQNVEAERQPKTPKGGRNCCSLLKKFMNRPCLSLHQQMECEMIKINAFL